MLESINEVLKFSWLSRLIESLVENIFGISMETNLGSSVHFFIYDTIKIIILLGIMIFLISYIRSYFSPEKTKKTLESCCWGYRRNNNR